MNQGPHTNPSPWKPRGPLPLGFDTCAKCLKATVGGSSYCGEHKCSQSGCTDAASSSWGKCTAHTSKNARVDDAEMGHVHYENGSFLDFHFQEEPADLWI